MAIHRWHLGPRRDAAYTTRRTVLIRSTPHSQHYMIEGVPYHLRSSPPECKYQDTPSVPIVGEWHMHSLFARTFGGGPRELMIELRNMVIVLLLVFYNATHLLCELPQRGLARLDKRSVSELGRPLRLKKNPSTNACIKAFSDIARHLALRDALVAQDSFDISDAVWCVVDGYMPNRASPAFRSVRSFARCTTTTSIASRH